MDLAVYTLLMLYALLELWGAMMLLLLFWAMPSILRTLLKEPALFAKSLSKCPLAFGGYNLLSLIVNIMSLSIMFSRLSRLSCKSLSDVMLQISSFLF